MKCSWYNAPLSINNKCTVSWLDKYRYTQALMWVNWSCHRFVHSVPLMVSALPLYFVARCPENTAWHIVGCGPTRWAEVRQCSHLGPTPMSSSSLARWRRWAYPAEQQLYSSTNAHIDMWLYRFPAINVLSIQPLENNATMCLEYFLS